MVVAVIAVIAIVAVVAVAAAAVIAIVAVPAVAAVVAVAAHNILLPKNLKTLGVKLSPNLWFLYRKLYQNSCLLW
ncbi:hypothetical protein [Helicobacter ailurogastricus]|uniref:hypothetical protein n=1 Tax=Helicobacter ailurogastricus TaxID=1578720 RepID=UPI0025541A22|nr:hypothetical protein [Helicobacter ailurogastricus]